MRSLQAQEKPLANMPWRRRVAEIVVPISPATRADDMEAWLLARIAEALEADPLAIDPTHLPSAYGFGVPAAQTLTRELARLLGRELPENVFAADRSVRAVARSLSSGTTRTTTLPLTREAMRQLVLARAARLPRRPMASLGAGPEPGPAGCSPSQLTHGRYFDLALAS